MRTGAPRKPVDPLKVARKMGELGATVAQLAEALGLTERQVYRRPDLCQAIKDAKTAADEAVEKSLYHRALGYSCPDTYFSSHQGVVSATPYTKHYPPSEVACIFWLKNRKPDQWREKTETQISGTLTGLPESLVLAIQQRAAVKARTKRNGTTDQAVQR